MICMQAPSSRSCSVQERSEVSQQPLQAYLDIYQQAAGVIKSNTQEMDKLWQEAILRFEQRTNKSLALNTATTSEDCQKAIEQIFQPGEDDASSEQKSGVKKAKEWGRDILSCLKLLGGSQLKGLVW